MSLITPSTHCRYSTMHLKSFQRFNISSFKGTGKGSVNQRFTEPFPFYALDWTYPYYIQFMRFRGLQLNHELNLNAV